MNKQSTRPVLGRLVILALLVFCMVALLPATALAYQTAYDFRYPLDSGGWFLGQAFGAWNKQQNAFHLAEDLLPYNYVSELPVYAPANGYVRHSGYQSGYGYVLVIEHRLPDNTYVCSVLGHLKAANLVPKGAEVVKGQLVGRISAYPAENGGYGFSHLHFGIRNGAYSTARDLDGAWRYQGYSPVTAVLASWQHPSNFVKAHSSPAPKPQPQPGSLQVSPTSLSFSLTRRGTYTPAKSYIVSGSGLSGSVQVRAPEGYWISTNPYSVSSFGKTITLRPSGGYVYQKIYVSFLPPKAGSFSSYITHSSSGVSTKYVRVSGWGY